MPPLIRRAAAYLGAAVVACAVPQSVVAAQAPPASTLSTRPVALRLSDTTWQYDLIATIARRPKHGPFFQIVVDISGPVSLGQHVRVEPPDAWWMTRHVPETFGVAPLSIQPFVRRWWFGTLASDGVLVLSDVEDPPFRNALRGGDTARVSFRSKGIPSLRIGELRPYEPHVSSDPHGDGEIREPTEVLAKRGLYLDTVRTAVVAPGVPPSMVDAKTIMEQIDLACDEHLLSETVCGELDRFYATWKPNAVRMAPMVVSMIRGAGPVHPLLEVTVMPQLALLATGTLPITAWPAR